MRTVRLYFDFISPYAYLGLSAAESFAAEHDVAWELWPVVYAKLLDATGLVGPGEVDVKRRYTWRDVLRCARRAGVPLVGPPAHPFRSLDAVRVAWLFREDARALQLARALSTAAWGEGRDLTDPEVRADVVASVGLDAEGLAERIAAPEVKDGVRRSTEAALAAGVFGVPTFEVDGQLFWGHDRLPHLADWLSQGPGDFERQAEVMDARPRAADRPSSPSAAEPSAGS